MVSRRKPFLFFFNFSVEIANKTSAFSFSCGSHLWSVFLCHFPKLPFGILCSGAPGSSEETQVCLGPPLRPRMTLLGKGDLLWADALTSDPANPWGQRLGAGRTLSQRTLS